MRKQMTVERRELFQARAPLSLVISVWNQEADRLGGDKKTKTEFSAHSGGTPYHGYRHPHDK